jgi:D-alanine-D-alanine ligase
MLVFGGQSSEHNAACQSFRYLYGRLIDQWSEPEIEVSHVAYVDRDGGVHISRFCRDRDVDSYMAADRSGDVTVLLATAKDLDLFVFGVMYGQNAEDGKLQGALEFADIKSNLGGVLPSALATSKRHMNVFVAEAAPRVLVPRYWWVTTTEAVRETLDALPVDRFVVKPNGLGSSILAERFSLRHDDLTSVSQFVEAVLAYDDCALLQEYVSGEEYSIGCLERNGEVEVLPPVKIEAASGFFGQQEKFIPGHVKETVLSDKQVPSSILLAQTFAKGLFSDLGFWNHARFDFIVNDAGLWFLEINPMPGVLRGGLYTKMLQAVGLDIESLITVAVANARRRRRLTVDFDLDVQV